MKSALMQQAFDFIKPGDRDYILAFDERMIERGYVSDGVGKGYCWGRAVVVERLSAYMGLFDAFYPKKLHKRNDQMYTNVHILD